MFVKEEMVRAYGSAEYMILGNPDLPVNHGNPATMLDPTSPLIMRLVNAGKSERKLVESWRAAVASAIIDCYGMGNLGMQASEMVRMVLGRLVACRLGESNFYVAAARVNELGVPNFLIGKQDVPGAYASVVFAACLSELHLRFETLKPRGGLWAHDMLIYNRNGINCPSDYSGARVRQWINLRKDRRYSDCCDLLVNETKLVKPYRVTPTRCYENVPVTPIVRPGSLEFD